MPSIAIWGSAREPPSGIRTRQLPLFGRRQQPPPGESVVINMNPTHTAQIPTSQPLTPTVTDKPKNEALFGPPIGVGSSASLPGWAKGSPEASSAGTIIPPEVIKDWIAKRKQESSKPSATTTLQALVNLKRPTIRLTPLSNPTEASPSPNAPHATAHGLEFDFDCDAARCNIVVSAFPPDIATASTPQPPKPTVLFHHSFDGGFGKTLRIEDGAVLELAKLEAELRSGEPSEQRATLGVNANPSQEGLGTTPAASGSTPDITPSGSRLAVPSSNQAGRKRLSAFNFRRKHDRQAAGPALQVVDADVEAAIQAARRASAEDHDFDELALNPSNGEGPSKANEAEADEGGVRIVICLEALDENDASLPNKNSQTTYLHILRLGSAPEISEEDHRPWVVKVVKREASIGPHTFRLQEIYGLASASGSQAQPAAPTTTPSYPPVSTVPNSSWDTPATECVLCLSSPREVVLLPCRHLVACRECAVNMVEFGAGGQLTHEIEASAATEGTQTEGDGGATNGTTTTTLPATPAPRRKRKAKGWFCPVCRQPYTSLLRIAPHPPGKVVDDDSSTVQSQEAAASPVVTEPHVTTADSTPEVALPPAPAPAVTREPSGGLSGVLSNLRLGLPKQQRAPPDDLESGNGVPSNTNSQTPAGTA